MLTTNTVIFFAISVEQGAALCSCQENIMRQCSPFKSQEHFGSEKPKLPPAGCKVPLKFSGFEEKAVSRRVGVLGSDVQWHSGT